MFFQPGVAVFDQKVHDPQPASAPLALTEQTLMHGLRVVCDADPDLARVAARLGPPPLWGREPGFATLVQIILEQQVSLASARATFERLQAVVDALTPAEFLRLDDTTLRAVGFSRQKAGYCRALAMAIWDGALDLERLVELDDAAVRRQLLTIKGIGPWTVDIYLLMALRRPDAWPSADLALAVAAQQVKGLAARPGPQALEALSAAWRPWRAVAARLLWSHYLGGA